MRRNPISYVFARDRRSPSRLVPIGAVAAAASMLVFGPLAPARAGDGDGDGDGGGGELRPDASLDVPVFVEVPGVREFSGRLIVRPRQEEDWADRGIAPAAARARIERARLLVADFVEVEYVPQVDHHIIEVPAARTENDLAAELLATGLFEYAEPDWIVYPIGCPNDSRFGNQWHHAAIIMNSCSGWDLHTGNSSVSVGICDTGIRTTHEDFQQHRLEGYNAVDQQWESQGGNISPVHPHGTQVTGCAAANGNNGVGISGVGWDLSHRMMRVSNSSGGGSSLSTLQHAARTSIEAGDKVASVSYSGADSSSNLSTATYIKSIGGLLVWAAGNDGRNLTFGNRDNDDLIVVGATDSNDNLAWFSAYGRFVDIVAPGVSVYTADSGFDTDYTSVSGTSFACPLTAGLAALLFSYDPSATPDEIEARLKAGTDDLGSTGTDDTFGYGRIDVRGALEQGGGGGGNQPPVADIAADTTSGDAPLLVNLDASSSFDPDGTITDHDWDFDGDGVYDQSTGSDPTTAVEYLQAGDYDATVRVTDDAGADDTAFVTINVTEPGGGGGDPTTIAFDGFESRSFSGGTGDWSGSWFGGGDVYLRWNRNSPNTGSGHVRLRSGNAYMERIVDTTGASDVSLVFWARLESFESSDRAEVWVSPDGLNYTRVRNFVNGEDDGIYREHVIDLSGFPTSSNFRIAFDADMSSRGDRWYVDDIEIRGIR